MGVDEPTEKSLCLADNRDDLISRLLQTVHEALFESRAFLRPSDLQRLASEEADAFFVFLNERDGSAAIERGIYLCRIGVSFSAVQQFGSELRQFCEHYLDETTAHSAREAVEEYHRELLWGYVHQRERTILEEQEHIRSALQHTLHQYTVQIETAAEVARATVSTLELDVLLTTAVELICERYRLDYVGIYLTDPSGDYAYLKAFSGRSGSASHLKEHRLAILGNQRWVAASQVYKTFSRAVRPNSGKTRIARGFLAQNRNLPCL